MLKGKKILIGVTGGIASYKIPNLVRLLIKAEAEVKVIMTPSATSFVTPVTLSTVSKNPVYIELFDSKTGKWNNHVELALWADLMVIAPLSANTLSKMAHGQSDNLLLTTYLSSKCPVMFAPAMDLDMYQHPTTKENIDKLVSFGHQLIPATNGELASGLSGEGRMEEPERIFEIIQLHFEEKKSLSNKTILVTAGPTYEALDPVRFIGNHSSGKMGIEIADELSRRGAKVILICGPSSVNHTEKSIERINIISAEEMYEAAQEYFPSCNAAILSAAVADYKPKEVSITKIKKNDTELSLELTKTHDVLSSLGKIKKDNQILVGFALETDNEMENAKTKLEKKNLDFIVLNSLQDKGAGFKGDTNKITILHRNNKIDNFELKSKKLVAIDIVNTLESKWK